MSNKDSKISEGKQSAVQPEATGVTSGTIPNTLSKGSKVASATNPDKGGRYSTTNPNAPPPTEVCEPPAETCNLPKNEPCIPECRCAKSQFCADNQRKTKRIWDTFPDHFPEAFIELRPAFCKPLLECCYDCRYCSNLIVRRWANERARYARRQYPLTTTYKTDYKAFKPSFPENDIRVMTQIRNWSSGPDFLHHAHLHSGSAPEAYESYDQHTYDIGDCCGRKNVLDHHNRCKLACCAGGDTHHRGHPDYRRKFTTLGPCGQFDPNSCRGDSNDRSCYYGANENPCYNPASTGTVCSYDNPRLVPHWAYPPHYPQRAPIRTYQV